MSWNVFIEMTIPLFNRLISSVILFLISSEFIIKTIKNTQNMILLAGLYILSRDELSNSKKPQIKKFF